MKLNQHIVFIINPKSGTMDKNGVEDFINSNLDRNIYSKYKVIYTQREGHATEIAQKYKDSGKWDIIVAVGGDGTVNEVASAIVDSDIILGVISMGSGNGLARHLNIPMDFKKAILQLNNSEIISIDYGLVNDKPFFCTCGTGFDAYVSKNFSTSKERGFVGYLKNTLKGYIDYKPETYQLKGEGIDIKGDAFVVTFANAAQWGYNAYIAPNASVQDGLIDISIISRVPLIAIPSIAIQLFTKTIHNDFFVNTLKTNEITLYRKESGAFHRDGEPYEEGKEIKIKMIRDGLKVLVKRRF